MKNYFCTDSVADAAVASISLLKGYFKSYMSEEKECRQLQFMCEANEECKKGAGGSIFCQLGSYAASYVLEKQTNHTFENLYEAGRMGRSMTGCKNMQLQCNEA